MTVVLMVLGAWVKATGSGLSCPDWPKCYGQWLPPFPSWENGGVDPATGDRITYWQAQILYEWGHRALATVLGAVFLVWAAVAWPPLQWVERVRAHRRAAWAVPPAAIVVLWLALLGTSHLAGHPMQAWLGDMGRLLAAVAVGSLVLWFLLGPLNPVVRSPALRTELHAGVRHAVFAGAWVLLAQGLLGGITVLGRNAPALTTAHMANAILFLLCVMTAVAYGFLRPRPPVPEAPPQRVVEVRYPGESPEGTHGG